MTKAWLIAFVLLIPFAYADPVLDAQKASLDVNAFKYVVQMDATIDFAKENNLSYTELEKIRNDFIEKNAKALGTDNKKELKESESGMRSLADQFKNETKQRFEYLVDDAKEEVKFALNKKKEEIKAKIDVAVEKRKEAIKIKLEERITQIRTYLEEQEIIGKEPKTYKILLERFEKEHVEINSTDFIDNLWKGDTGTSKIKNLGSTLIGTFKNMLEQMGGH